MKNQLCIRSRWHRCSNGQNVDRILCLILLSTVKKDVEEMEKALSGPQMINSLKTMPSNSLTLVYQTDLQRDVLTVCREPLQGTET